VRQNFYTLWNNICDLVVETAGPHHLLTYYFNFAFGGGHVHIALTFARLFTIIILLSCKMYFAFISVCKWTNAVCWLCL